MLLHTVLYSIMVGVSVMGNVFKTDTVIIAKEISYLRDQISDSQMLKKIATNNVVACTRQCAQLGGCCSLFYDERNGICQLHGGLLDPIFIQKHPGTNIYVGSSSYTTAQGYSHYRLKKRAPYNATYLGCYSDKAVRDLDGFLAQPFEDNSKNTCISFCYQSCYRYGGLQTGNACLCGNSFGRYGKLDETSCSDACSGDNTGEKCGGGWANSVYATGL